MKYRKAIALAAQTEINLLNQQLRAMELEVVFYREFFSRKKSEVSKFILGNLEGRIKKIKTSLEIIQDRAQIEFNDAAVMGLSEVNIPDEEVEKILGEWYRLPQEQKNKEVR